jgi:hypothetical protein
MTGPAPGGALDAESLIERIDDGSLPKDFILHAARGYLPLAQEELVTVLAVLTSSGDEEVRTLSRSSLGEMPNSVLAAFASNQTAGARYLDLLASATSDPLVLEAIARNRSTPDFTVQRLAATAPPVLQDVIVTNQERILRTPGILEELLANPQLSPDVRRRALETREEFFDKQRRQQERESVLLEEELSTEGEEIISDLLERAAAEDAAGAAAAETVPAVDHPDHLPAYNRILKMTVSEKIRCAFKGGKSERAILIRDRNKIVCTAVLRNGRINESEIEGFASSRSVEDEVLRVIGMNRNWMSKYPVMLALVRNPRAPIGVVLPLVNRLTLKDLLLLSKDRNVSDVVRKTASRLSQQKESRRN